MNENINGFHGLGIAPKFLEILGKNNYVTPTPIQTQSIPVAIQGKDVIGIAQTGTGKTLAFGIPMLQNLVTNKGKGLVLVPTRELAIQVDESIQKIGRSIGLKSVVLIGGEDIKRQTRKLKQDPHIIIATPGRLIDHLEHRTARLDEVKILVLDEADRMFDMGFAPQIKKILAKVPHNRQTMLFSATMPQEIVALAVSYMKMPTRVEVAPAGSTGKDISQELFFVDRHDKSRVLESILEKYKGSVLVFTRTKYEAKKVAKLVRDMKHSSSEIHSNRSLGQRREALQGFKLGKYRVLVATDIAARGIDVTGIELVINYDLPANAEDYIHRIGRTGRAGSVGHAISLAMPNQRADVRSIERVIKQTLKISEHGLKGRPVQTQPSAEYRTESSRPFESRPRTAYAPRRPEGRSAYPSREGGERKPYAARAPYSANRPQTVGRSDSKSSAYPKREVAGSESSSQRSPYAQRRVDSKSGFPKRDGAPREAFSHRATSSSKPAMRSFSGSKPFSRSRKPERDRHPAPRGAANFPKDEPFSTNSMKRNSGR